MELKYLIIKQMIRYFSVPLSKVNIISPGTNYDVINPPQIGISSSGSGAVIQPVIKGSLVDAFVDPQELGIAKVVSIGITGGNGSGAVIAPVIENDQENYYLVHLVLHQKLVLVLEILVRW